MTFSLSLTTPLHNPGDVFLYLLLFLIRLKTEGQQQGYVLGSLQRRWDSPLRKSSSHLRAGWTEANIGNDSRKARKARLLVLPTDQEHPEGRGCPLYFCVSRTQSIAWQSSSLNIYAVDGKKEGGKGARWVGGSREIRLGVVKWFCQNWHQNPVRLFFPSPALFPRDCSHF